MKRIFGYGLLIIIGLLISYIIVFKIGDLNEKLSFGFFFLTVIIGLYRSYLLNNYFRILDGKEKVNYIDHHLNMIIDIQKSFAFFLLIKPIIKKDTFEKQRKKINLVTIVIYFFLLIVLIFSLKN